MQGLLRSGPFWAKYNSGLSRGISQLRLRASGGNVLQGSDVAVGVTKQTGGTPRILCRAFPVPERYQTF